jgi:inosose dehydratase
MDSNLVRLGIAPIGWTNDDMPELGGEIPFEQCVSEMALAGYEGTEVGGKYPKDPTALTSALSLRKLQVCNAWCSTFLTSKPIDFTVNAFREQCAFLRAVGATVVGISEQGGSVQGDPAIPVLKGKPIFDDGAWTSLADGIKILAGHAREFGITLTFHHHMGTGVQTAAETRKLLDMTDPDDLGLLFDTGHFAMSGELPVAVLEEFLPRVRHVHLKDLRPNIAERVRSEDLSFLDAVRAGVFTVPGDGSIDYAPIFSLLEGAGYKGWMVVEAEQDPAIANPLEYAMKGRAYIRNTAGL